MNYICLTLGIFFWGAAFSQNQANHYKRKIFIDALLHEMTLEEKAGQLTICGGDHDNLKESIKNGRVGGTNGLLYDLQ